MTKLLDPVPARAAAYVAFYPMLHAVAKRHGMYGGYFDISVMPKGKKL